jgi:NAD+ kinase
VSRRVLLLVNRLKPKARALEGEVSDLIRAHGTLAGVHDGGQPVPVDTLDGIDLVVAIGGDGTLLATARSCLGSGVPVLGVNAGKLGFLAEYDAGTLAEDAAEIFDAGHPLSTEELPTLLASVESDGHERWRGEALNEFVITAGPPYRIISMRLSFDATRGPRVNGDGLIVSTPLGSTAYNVSAGGPIAAPGSTGMIVTPIAAHSLAFRPLALAAATTLDLDLVRANDTERPGTALVADGRVSTPVATGDRVRVTATGRTAVFVRNPRSSYWTTLVDKMGWGASPVKE